MASAEKPNASIERSTIARLRVRRPLRSRRCVPGAAASAKYSSAPGSSDSRRKRCSSESGLRTSTAPSLRNDCVMISRYPSPARTLRDLVFEPVLGTGYFVRGNRGNDGRNPIVSFDACDLFDEVGGDASDRAATAAASRRARRRQRATAQPRAARWRSMRSAGICMPSKRSTSVVFNAIVRGSPPAMPYARGA